MVAAGSFRQDLLFRLDVLQLQVPPLRERTEDILLLAEVFLARACAQTGRPACAAESGGGGGAACATRGSAMCGSCRT